MMLHSHHLLEDCIRIYASIWVLCVCVCFANENLQKQTAKHPPFLFTRHSCCASKFVQQSKFVWFFSQMNLSKSKQHHIFCFLQDIPACASEFLHHSQFVCAVIFCKWISAKDKSHTGCILWTCCPIGNDLSHNDGSHCAIQNKTSSGRHVVVWTCSCCPAHAFGLDQILMSSLPVKDRASSNQAHALRSVSSVNESRMNESRVRTLCCMPNLKHCKPHRWHCHKKNPTSPSFHPPSALLPAFLILQGKGDIKTEHTFPVLPSPPGAWLNNKWLLAC